LYINCLYYLFGFKPIAKYTISYILKISGFCVKVVLLSALFGPFYKSGEAVSVSVFFG